MAVPTVTSVTPATGPQTGGQTVTLAGTGFTGATAVKFGGVAATSFAVGSDTAMTAVVPQLAAGVVDVIVTNPTGPSVAGAGDRLTVTPGSLSYSQPDGDASGTQYFQDVTISPATVQSGELRDRLDTVRYPQRGSVAPGKTGVGAAQGAPLPFGIDGGPAA